MKKLISYIMEKMKEIYEIMAKAFRKVSEELEEEAKKDDPVPEPEEVTRVDANGIRLFPKDLDLNYVNSNGRIPGRPNPKDVLPKKYDRVLKPIEGDNWNHVKEAFKKGGNIYVGSGVYEVEVVPQKTVGGDLGNPEDMIMVADNSNIVFDKDAVFRMRSTNYGQKENRYQIIHVYNKENVNIWNPRLIGDKNIKPDGYKPDGTEEWACGILIDRGCKNINIFNPHITEFWGDAIATTSGGMRHSQDISKTNSNKPELVKIRNVYLDDNGRNNISNQVCRDFDWDGGIIGTADRVAPTSGMDIEPASHPTFVRGFKMRNVKFVNGSIPIITFNGSMDADIDDIEFYGTTGQTLISRGTSTDTETEIDGKPEGYTQYHRRWKIGNYETKTSGNLFIYMSKGRKVFEEITFVNSRSPQNILIQYGRGGIVEFNNIKMDGFKSFLVIDDNRDRPNVGDVTFRNVELRNGNFDGGGRDLADIKTESKIHIENLKAENVRGFIIRKASEIFLKDIQIKVFKGSGTTAGGHMFRVNAQKGTKVFMQNITVNGIKIPDKDFTAQEDQTVVWLDNSGKLR